MASAKFLDAIARLPGCSGADSDADSAYTQVVLADMEDSVETWVTIPKHRRPKKWDPRITDPVCRLRLNLYGHPLAGLHWEKHCQKAIFAAGFVKVQGHECLHVHREKQLFLSVYVDDFKMAGKTSNLSTMWETLGKKIFLDPPVPLQSNVYLGSSQTPVEVPLKDLQQKFDTWKGFFHDKGGQKEPENAETASAAQSHGQDADQRCPSFASLDSKELDPAHNMGSLKREGERGKLQKEKIQGYQ